MRYLLNSAVITAPGLYRYALLSVQDAEDWYYDGELPLSAIGYAETAAALGELLGTYVPVHRVQIVMSPGDEALVFRLALPPGTPRIDPADKGRLGNIVRSGQFELGLLLRIE